MLSRRGPLDVVHHWNIDCPITQSLFIYIIMGSSAVLNFHHVNALYAWQSCSSQKSFCAFEDRVVFGGLA